MTKKHLEMTANSVVYHQFQPTHNLCMKASLGQNIIPQKRQEKLEHRNTERVFDSNPQINLCVYILYNSNTVTLTVTN